ncbi:unknown [Salmonella phage FelixO1]|uniref:Uncharacterized protein n=1 Tax=Salmonella phage Felix O1 (isolate Felix O1-VT1) TaxID=1283336 RepID=Q6KGB8_BPFO1|nr:unknown [Salmonella phage FelixO1]
MIRGLNSSTPQSSFSYRDSFSSIRFSSAAITTLVDEISMSIRKSVSLVSNSSLSSSDILI